MLTVISLYTGMGGLDFGFEAAGFRTRVAVEIDQNACRTIRLNRDWPVLGGDIHDSSSGEILEKAGLRVGEADALIGGPPCQPFSKSSYWVHGDSLRLKDPRADTLEAFLRVLRDTKPRCFLLENVHGIAYKAKDEGLRYLLAGIEEVNRTAGTCYSVNWASLNAADFGVPQLRQRVFLVGFRDGTRFRFPQPTHFDKQKTKFWRFDFEPYRTAWDALCDLPQEVDDPTVRVGGKWADLLPSIPEGSNYLWHTSRGGGQSLFGWRTRYWSFLLKLAKDLPSWTIQAQPGSAIGPFHWSSRRLTAMEMCRLQTFPDGLKFECGRSEVQKLIGNAVPSLLAEVLAREIQKKLLDSPPSHNQPSLLPAVRTPVPPPAKVVPVPTKYLRFEGDHSDHPGEGNGARAVRNRAEAASKQQHLPY